MIRRLLPTLLVAALLIHSPRAEAGPCSGDNNGLDGLGCTLYLVGLSASLLMPEFTARFDNGHDGYPVDLGLMWEVPISIIGADDLEDSEAFRHHIMAAVAYYINRDAVMGRIGYRARLLPFSGGSLEDEVLGFNLLVGPDVFIDPDGVGARLGVRVTYFHSTAFFFLASGAGWHFGADTWVAELNAGFQLSLIP